MGLELDLADSYWFDTPQAAAEIAEAAAERAREAGDEVGEAAACVMAAQCRLPLEGSRVDELESLARAALPLLERAHDHAGLVHVWEALGQVANFRCRYEEWWEAWEQANRHARLARQPGKRPFGLELALVFGPRPADEALRALDAAVPDDPRPWTSLNRAVLLAMLARFEEARPLADEASERLRELTGAHLGDWLLAEIATLAGDHATAAEHLRRWCDRLEQRRLPGYLSTHASVLGRSLCALRRYEEAEPLAQLGRERGSEDDVATQALWRQVQARVRAHRGEHVEAEALAREAAAALEQALDRYERKKNLAMVAQVRPKLEKLRKAAPA
jgi:hypothetical protein